MCSFDVYWLICVEFVGFVVEERDMNEILVWGAFVYFLVVVCVLFVLGGCVGMMLLVDVVIGVDVVVLMFEV